MSSRAPDGEAPGNDQHHGAHGEVGTQRIEAFSDGVFAIAITLLIIEIAVPHVEGDQSLGTAIRDLWPSYFAYVLSFITIGIYWANHHTFFKFFHATDHVFLMLNVLFLMCIAFLPFPTAVLGDYLDNDSQRQAAVTLYCVGLLAPTIPWSLLWWWGNLRDLIDERLAPDYTRYLTRQYALSITAYFVAVLVSFVNPWAALAVAGGITAVYVLPPRRPRYVD